MPFVVRRIEPKYVGRGHVPQDSVTSETWPVGAELYATSNGTLASTLRQLASLLSVAEDVFGELTAELTNVAARSGVLRHRIDRLEDHLSTIDPKKIPVRKFLKQKKKNYHLFKFSKNPYSLFFSVIFFYLLCSHSPVLLGNLFRR